MATTEWHKSEIICLTELSTTGVSQPQRGGMFIGFEQQKIPQLR
jgi:hypothetical protein